MLQQNEALAKLTALARKSGVTSSFDDIRNSVTDAAISQHRTAIVAPSRSADEHVRDLVFNSAIREIFLHYFVQVGPFAVCIKCSNLFNIIYKSPFFLSHTLFSFEYVYQT